MRSKFEGSGVHMVVIVEGGIWNVSWFWLHTLDTNCLYNGNLQSLPHLSGVKCNGADLF